MQKKKGVSLIVLVITIIVMVILAGAIILTLDNAGIIERAENAVEKYNLNEIKSLANVAWGEAYMNGARTEQELKDQVTEILNKQKIDLTPYYLDITTKGVEVGLKTEKAGWKQEGLTVTNGKVTLEIGDSIAYDETNGRSITGLTNTEWAVLGANEQGELLIMSTSDVVSSYRLGYESTMTDAAEKLQECQNDWLTGPDQLDKQCEPYGKGKGATSARSIRVEDVNKVTGYDPETHGKGNVNEYGNEVTYSYNGTTTPAYLGSNGRTGTLVITHSNGFHYYNGEKFVTISDLTTGTKGTSFAKLKSNAYYYYPTTLTTSSSGEQKGIGTDTRAYKMLFGGKYWLASPCVITNAESAYFGVLNVGNGDVDHYDLWSSVGRANCLEFGVRAVVSLASDINITGSSASGWSF